MKKTKTTHGGSRPGSGRKSPFKEATTQVKFSPPISKVAELKSIVKNKFEQWVKEGV